MNPNSIIDAESVNKRIHSLDLLTNGIHQDGIDVAAN